MIRSNNRSNFYLDISKAEFIPSDVMKQVKAQLARATAMMPSQDVLDLAINGASKVIDLEQVDGQRLLETQRALEGSQATVNALKTELASVSEALTKSTDMLERLEQRLQ